MIYKAKQFVLIAFLYTYIFKKTMQVLILIRKLSEFVLQNVIKSHWIDDFLQNYFSSSVKWIKRIWKNKIKPKRVKVMNFSFKTGSSHLFLSNTFDDKFWRSHLSILPLIFSARTKVTLKKHSILTTFCYYFLAFDQKNYRFKTQEHSFWSTLACLHPSIDAWSFSLQGSCTWSSH